MYNLSLKTGDIVSIYTDFKEEKGYEGEAILISRVREGDTYLLADEFVASDPEMKGSPNPIKNKYNELLYDLLNDKNNPIKEFDKYVKDMLKLRRSKNESYNKMYLHTLKVKLFLHQKDILKKYTNDNRFKRLLRIIPIDHIVRYFQQYDKKVNNSIFRYEMWKVQFISNQIGIEENRVALRKIRYLIKNNYKVNKKKSELSMYMTYNNKSTKIRDEEEE